MNLKAIFTSPVFYLIALIIGIRFIGTWHGFPFVYNVDEPTLVKTTLSLRFDPWIERFDWPHFNYYFHYFIYVMFIKWRSLMQTTGLDVHIKNLFPILWDDPFVFYFLSRSINTALSILSALPVYLISRDIYGKRVGLFTTLVYLLFPYLGEHSRYAIQDSAMMCWLSFFFLFIYKYFKTDKLKHLIFASIFLGLATAVKYNAVLFFALVPILCIFRVNIKNRSELFKYIGVNIMAGLVLTGVFLLFNPSIFRYFNLFWSDKYQVGIFWQFKSNLTKYPMLQVPLEVLRDYWAMLMGTAVFSGIAFIIFPWASRKIEMESKDRSFMWVIWSVALWYLIYAARIELSGQRFYLPIYPIVAISACAASSLLSKYKYSMLVAQVYLGFLVLLGIYNGLMFLKPSTLHVAYDKYKELDADSTVFIQGEDIERLNLLNNLKLKMIRSDNIPQSGDYIIGSRPLNIENSTVVMNIDPNDSYIKKQGPTIYIYKKN